MAVLGSGNLESLHPKNHDIGPDGIEQLLQTNPENIIKVLFTLSMGKTPRLIRDYLPVAKSLISLR